MSLSLALKSAKRHTGFEAVHYLDESHILVFLLQVLVLLGSARTLAALCERFGIPALAGEICAGIALGPTLFGRVAPVMQSLLFPDGEIQSTMLETASWLGVFFLLLASGFHVDVTHAMRRGKAALLIGVVGVLFPIALGYPFFHLLGAEFRGDASTPQTFALFLAVAGSITAISVVARALGDLGIAKTSVGSLALSSCAINDVFGWFLFTLVMSLVTAHEVETSALVTSIAALVAFITLGLWIGARVLSAAAARVKKTSLAQPAALMTLVVSAGLLCGVVTQALGIHAILGFFLAGTMAGSAEEVSEGLRDSLSDTVHAIFVPLFFASLGLKIDFIAGMSLWATCLFCAVAMGGKFIGAWLGARLGSVEGRQAILMGLIFVPGGAMEIVVATLALELRLIAQSTFVAIVFAALFSSVVAGPLVGMQVRRMGIGGAAPAR